MGRKVIPFEQLDSWCKEKKDRIGDRAGWTSATTDKEQWMQAVQSCFDDDLPAALIRTMESEYESGETAMNAIYLAY